MIVGKISTAESPIEEEMLDALLSVCGTSVRLSRNTTYGELWRMAIDEANRGTIFIVPQMRVGRFRADYILAGYDKPIYPKFVCVECDGYAYHRASSDQIMRDMNRDFWFEGNCINVRRYTGRQIRRDRYACAYDALSLFSEKHLSSGTGFTSLGGALCNVLHQTADTEDARMTGDRE